VPEGGARDTQGISEGVLVFTRRIGCYMVKLGFQIGYSLACVTLRLLPCTCYPAPVTLHIFLGTRFSGQSLRLGLGDTYGLSRVGSGQCLILGLRYLGLVVFSLCLFFLI
jgi:hypothetical protein